MALHYQYKMVPRIHSVALELPCPPLVPCPLFHGHGAGFASAFIWLTTFQA